MTRLFCRLILIATIITALSLQDLNASDDVLSMAQGVGALQELAFNAEFQKEVKVSAAQLTDLKETVLRKNFRRASVEADSEAKAELLRILSIDQVGIVRKSVLKRRFLTPLHLFDINFLSELGLTEDEIVSITKMVVPFGIELQKSLDLMRISALELITKELPLESADLFWQFFGRSLETKSEDAEWETICVLVEASVEKQLNLAIGMQLPKELELTKEQRSEVRELENEWRMKEIKGDLANRTVTVSKQLDRVLSKRQRYALVQRIQQQTLRSDLLVAIRPEVVKRLGIDPKIAGEFKAQLIVIDQDIKRSQLARQMEFFMKAIAILPATKRYTIIDLFDGVWTK